MWWLAGYSINISATNNFVILFFCLFSDVTVWFDVLMLANFNHTIRLLLLLSSLISCLQYMFALTRIILKHAKALFVCVLAVFIIFGFALKMFSCQVCSSEYTTLSAYVRCMRIQRDIPNSVSMYILSDYKRSYITFEAFKSHTYRHHTVKQKCKRLEEIYRQEGGIQTAEYLVSWTPHSVTTITLSMLYSCLPQWMMLRRPWPYPQLLV